MNRRRFLRVGACGLSGALLRPGQLAAQDAADPAHLVILHTNDTHSRMDPFPMDGGPFQGLGGVARRMSLIKQVRDSHPNVLLLDSGDIFQGTPYFNFFGGEIEFKAMSAMGYDAATIGNHDFDNGVGGLASMLPHASFRLVSANYDVSRSALSDHVTPWIIRELGGIRVGIFGLGIGFEGLVLPVLHQRVRYLDPYLAAERCVEDLRREGCSLVICLSHLGYRYRGNAPSDTRLAQEVDGIDLILGGHTHTFMETPDVHVRADGGRCVVNQVGWGGMRLGRIDALVPVASDPAYPVPGPVGAGPHLRETVSKPHRAIQWRFSQYAVNADLD